MVKMFVSKHVIQRESMVGEAVVTLYRDDLDGSGDGFDGGFGDSLTIQVTFKGRTKKIPFQPSLPFVSL